MVFPVNVKEYAVDRVTFEDITNTEPTKVEHLADSMMAPPAEQFDLLYGKLDLPVYTDEELKNLQNDWKDHPETRQSAPVCIDDTCTGRHVQ